MDGDFFSFFILCQCLFVVWCQRKPEHYMIMVVTQFFNKTGKKRYFLSHILQNYGLMCAWIELKILLVYTPYAKGALVQNDALIVPNYGH